jgi:hypothetical protein
MEVCMTIELFTTSLSLLPTGVCDGCGGPLVRPNLGCRVIVKISNPTIPQAFHLYCYGGREELPVKEPESPFRYDETVQKVTAEFFEILWDKNIDIQNLAEHLPDVFCPKEDAPIPAVEFKGDIHFAINFLNKTTSY